MSAIYIFLMNYCGCLSVSGEAASRDHQVVVMPIVDALSKRPPYMPLSFPEDLAPRLR